MLTNIFFHLTFELYDKYKLKEIKKMRRTLEGTKVKRQKVSGFRARMATPGGQEVLNRRRAKGRHKLAITAKKRA